MCASGFAQNPLNRGLAKMLSHVTRMRAGGCLNASRPAGARGANRPP